MQMVALSQSEASSFFFNKTVLSITVCCMVFKLKAFFPTIVSCVYPCQDLIILLTKINKERVLAVFFFYYYFLNTKHNHSIFNNIRQNYILYRKQQEGK